MDEVMVGNAASGQGGTTAPIYRNGYSRKTVKPQLWEIDIKVPRGRKDNNQAENHQQICPHY